MTASQSPRRAVENRSLCGEATTPAPDDVHAVTSTPVRDAQAPGSPLPPGPRTFTIALPWERIVSSNERAHRFVVAKVSKQIRADAKQCALSAKIPSLGQVRVVAEISFPNARRRDAHNFGGPGGLKPAIDGLVDAGVLVDDSDAYVVSTSIKPGPVQRLPYPVKGETWGLITIHLTELPEETPHV